MFPLNLNQLIRQEDWDNVVALIDAGADIHVASGNGYTPLMQAVEVGSFELVDYLLARGVFVNFSGREGNTALHIAVSVALEYQKGNFVAEKQRSLEMVSLLLSRGADPRQQNEAGASSIDWSKQAFSKTVLSLLEC
jgi:ankyrin repeat protein